jgi:uncharacterized protein involved in outer membrane biogenesis
MFKLIKRLFRWALYLFIVVVVLVVAAVLLLDTIVKQVVQSRLRSATGMEVRIGKMDIGLGTPTIAIEDLKIYNTPEFGGSLFLSVPEIYVDYDRAAIRAHKVHLNLVRITLAEMDVVQDKKGRNLQSIAEKSQAVGEEVKKQMSAFTFTGLDTLNVTLQKLRLWRLDSAARVEEVNFGISNEVFTNLKTGEDWQNMAVLLAARSSASAAHSTNPPIDLAELLQPLVPRATKK